MVGAEEGEAGGAGAAVGGKEEGGVDLKMARRIGGDVGARDDVEDAIPEAHNKAAALVRKGIGGRVSDSIGVVAENLDRHIISVAQWGRTRRQSR